jgi:hypothetical protein
MKIPQILTTAPKSEGSSWRYLRLALNAVIVVWLVGLWFSPPVGGTRVQGALTAVMFGTLLQNVAFDFRWSMRTTVVLRLASMALSGLSVVYLIWAILP